jgi:amidophosphoribosyltransferase
MRSWRKTRLSISESCGVFGVSAGAEEAFPYLYWGMLAQNHRGHQSHGFATFNGKLENYSELGLIPPVTEYGIREKVRILKGTIGIGNVRYTTSGSSDITGLHRDAMPIVVTGGSKSVAISFNGNVVNVRSLQDQVGVNRKSSDAHALSRLILDGALEFDSVEEGAKSCMKIIDGSFSIVGLDNEGTLFAFKDPHGIKPLCYGCSDDYKAFSSESVGLNINGIEYEREIQPGEFMQIQDGEVYRKTLIPCKNRAFCAFEFAYFARPDSLIEGAYVYQARQNFGANLSRMMVEETLDCDVVLSLPESANDAAYGFHVDSGLPWDMATRRHRYVTQRAFITGGNDRENIILRKINILNPKIKGKKLAVIDDSIVRGDTTRNIIKKLRAAGAKKVHMFITYPMITGPCFYGIDMATYGELIGACKDSNKIAQTIKADSVIYQDIYDYVKATGMKRNQLCFGCVTGEYPTPMANQLALRMRERLNNGETEKGRIYENEL